MSVLTSEFPPVPFDGASDAILTYCPNSGTYRLYVGDSTGSAMIAPHYMYDQLSYVQRGFLSPLAGSRSFILSEGSWVAAPDNFGIYLSESFGNAASPVKGDYAGFPIASTFNLSCDYSYMPSYLVPEVPEDYVLYGSNTLYKLDQVHIADTVLSSEIMSKPMLDMFYSVTPVLIGVLVGFVAIRKGIAFFSTRLRGA